MRQRTQPESALVEGTYFSGDPADAGVRIIYVELELLPSTYRARECRAQSIL